MSKPVQLYCWHFMSYPYLPANFDQAYDTGWVTVPNRLWDSERSRGLYQEYIDQLAYADEIGFDGMVLNEHHQNIYGLMPSPNLIAAALSQKTKRGKIVILGNLLPLHLNPLRVAEEYAMLDNMSDGRLIAGFAPGSGPETFNYDVPSAPSREQFWEAVDLIHRAWTVRSPGRAATIPCATSIPGRSRRRSRIRRSGSRAHARPRPCSTSPSAAIAIFSRRAATAARPRNRRRNSPRFSRTTATASIPSAWAS
jgi:alkanesulfonate monooxygenase SsuD/methylene tetrahydromethanopterin reductase-like flavin-dependent oxidoreductase (luciferase family)